MRSLSIRTRLILLFTLQILIIILVGGLYLDWRLKQTLENELANKLEVLAKSISFQMDGELLLNLTAGDENTRTYRRLLNQLLGLQKQANLRRLYILSKDKKSFVDTRSKIPIGKKYAFLPITNIELEEVFSGKTVSSILFEGSDNRLYKTGFAPIFSQDKVVAALAVEGSAQTLAAIRTVRRDLSLLGIAVLFGSLILALFFSKKITTPINELKMATMKIAQGNYTESIQTQSKDEIGFLGQTMEEMRKAIVQRDIRQKAMLAGVAHEIRNPLGGIELFAGLLRNELKGDSQKQAEKIQKEVQNLKKIINDFLHYARPGSSKKESCTIKEVFDDAAALLARELNGVAVDFNETKKATTVWVDPQHLKQIFLNLLKNSVQALNGSGDISLEAKDEDSMVQLTFSDNGPGISPEIREQIFEPFFTNRKDGTGLGLAIVKSLVEENGGEIEIKKGEEAIFQISLRKE